MLKQNSVPVFSTMQRSSCCRDLCHTCSTDESALPTFISLAPFRDISSTLCLQRVPLHTACACVPAISLKSGKGHLPAGPINSQPFTGLEFGSSMYSFAVDCKSHSLNWIFLCKVLAKSLFFLVTFSHSRGTSKRAEMKTGRNDFCPSAHLAVREEGFTAWKIYVHQSPPVLFIQFYSK